MLQLFGALPKVTLVWPVSGPTHEWKAHLILGNPKYYPPMEHLHSRVYDSCLFISIIVNKYCSGTKYCWIQEGSFYPQILGLLSWWVWMPRIRVVRDELTFLYSDPVKLFTSLWIRLLTCKWRGKYSFPTFRATELLIMSADVCDVDLYKPQRAVYCDLDRTELILRFY